MKKRNGKQKESPYRTGNIYLSQQVDKTITQSLSKNVFIFMQNYIPVKIK